MFSQEALRSAELCPLSLVGVLQELCHPSWTTCVTQPESPTAAPTAATNLPGTAPAPSPAAFCDFSPFGADSLRQGAKTKQQKDGKGSINGGRGEKRQRSDESKVVSLPLVLAVLPEHPPHGLCAGQGTQGKKRSHLRLLFTKKTPSGRTHKEIKSESSSL